MFSIFSGFNKDKLKSSLRMAESRAKLKLTKLANESKPKRREIAGLLQKNKEENARIKCESLIREDHLVEALESVSLFCEILAVRIQLLTESKTILDELREPIYCIIYACPRLELTELFEAREQLLRKFPELADKNRVPEANVNTRLVHRLSSSIPPVSLVNSYLKSIAAEFKVDWAPIEDEDEEETIPEEVLKAGKAAAASSSSVPSGPATFIPLPPTSHLTSDNLQILKELSIRSDVPSASTPAGPAPQQQQPFHPVSSPSLPPFVPSAPPPSVISGYSINPDSLPPPPYQQESISDAQSESAQSVEFDELQARFDALKKRM